MSNTKSTRPTTIPKVPDDKEKSVERFIDPVRSRILNELRVNFQGHSKEFLLKTAKNFAFLSRQYAGSNLQSTSVSVPLVDTYADGDIIGHRMALVIHEKPGKMRVLLQHSSPADHMSCLLAAMAQSAEKVVAQILEGEKGRVVFGMLDTKIC
ncbi:unnamed protein product [Periconia digitata]|uniref:Uncharacterized protein n=1 Tax=Periconia digitata TaxID=1303443 RepID=A0A9W4UII3_9PLEO|nr:unnamed protein product [Periconia digitata]